MILGRRLTFVQKPLRQVGDYISVLRVNHDQQPVLGGNLHGAE